MRWLLVAAFVLTSASAAVPSAAGAAPALVPAPQRLEPVPCRTPVALDRPLRFAAGTDPGGFAIVRERWTALGIPAPVLAAPGAPADVRVQLAQFSAPPGPGDRYVLRAADGNVLVSAANDRGTGEAGFDALMTLAQLPERSPHGWSIACTRIDDFPAMRWRIVSDDVSRGPFPTLRYAEERIRTLASLKINGWSPYMENVVVDPRYPFVASPNGWTAVQLHALAQYARRFHVTLIPEQQSFSHMHEALKWEELAPLAELPHGYLVSESDPRTYAYLGPLLREVVDATKPTPFVHLGADEPVDLGRGRTPRTPQVFADHVARAASFLAGSGARPMIWDDALQQDPRILALLPKNTVIVTWHYGDEASFRRYIDPIADAGFEQLVAPGASNWTEIYPDLTTAYANVARLVADGKAAHGVLGMFMTDWHDDGETLYEATWPALAYAAATAWQTTPVDDATWQATFARAFFGTDDPRYARDLDALRAMRDLLRTKPSDPVDYVFWHDPFDPRLQARAGKLDLAALRDRAESVLTDLWSARPPLHAQAARVMKLAALRYDALGRRLQIGKEAHDDYAEAAAHAKDDDTLAYRDLYLAKYLCWELRDELTQIQPLYAAAWRYESTEPGLARVVVRYRAAEAGAQRDADRIDAATREDRLRAGTLPSWDTVISSEP